jgi:segregation and condensation protein A
MTSEDVFTAEPRAEGRGEQLILDLDGFEGPLDVLLDLARDQKVDLTQISILELADQYLDFVTHASKLSLELAADYLVMAAWLAYLKSRLLLPQSAEGEEPSGPEMAAALRFQLRRLEAMRDVAARLMSRPRLGAQFFGRGEPEDIGPVASTVFEVSLYDLLKSYSAQQRRGDMATLTIEPMDLYSIEDAMLRLNNLLGASADWATLMSFLPEELKVGMGARSALASTLAASLEMARAGKITLRQDSAFGPIFVRNKRDGK